MRLSTKVAIALSSVVAVVGGAATTLATLRQASEQRAEFRETNLRALELLGLALAPAVAEGRHHRVQAVLDNVANFPERYPDVKSMSVVDLRGRIIADMDPTRFGDEGGKLDPSAEATVVEHGSGELEVVMPLRLAHPVGILRAQLDERRLQSAVDRERIRAGAFLVSLLVALGVVLHVLHRRVLGAPIAELASVASDLKSGRMGVRAPVRRDDELGQLGRAFNEMAQHLEAYTTSLEDKVRERTKELEAVNHRLEELATTDALTGLCNRGHFEECGARQLAEARRRSAPVALVLSDIDRFKSFNDRYGHAFGDEVLRHVAKIFRAEVREGDLVARIGGEELAVLMPDATTDEAARAAERIRARLEATALEENGERVTASFGVTSTEDAPPELDKLLKAADDALYASKRDGRNRVSLAPPSSTGRTGS
jgi:diguanylate cyclase (GGDEF)-like protein